MTSATKTFAGIVVAESVGHAKREVWAESGVRNACFRSRVHPACWRRRGPNPLRCLGDRRRRAILLLRPASKLADFEKRKQAFRTPRETSFPATIHRLILSIHHSILPPPKRTKRGRFRPRFACGGSSLGGRSSAQAAA